MCTRCAFIGGIAAFAGSAAVAQARSGDPQALEIAMPGMQRISDNLWLGKLTQNVWIHTTTHDIGNGIGSYPANGAIVIDGDEALLVDTGWIPRHTQDILNAWNDRKLPRITKAVVTHFHYDRLGGIPELSKRGVPAFGNPLTIGLAIDAGFAPPKPLHALEKQPRTIGSVEVFYPGAGHTIDNVVVWVPRDRVLFGGCLVKATTAGDLGNVEDADVSAWPSTMKNLSASFTPSHVIPGHGTLSGDSLAHTASLATAANLPDKVTVTRP